MPRGGHTRIGIGPCTHHILGSFDVCRSYWSPNWPNSTCWPRITGLLFQQMLKLETHSLPNGFFFQKVIIMQQNPNICKHKIIPIFHICTTTWTRLAIITTGIKLIQHDFVTKHKSWNTTTFRQMDHWQIIRDLHLYPLGWHTLPSHANAEACLTGWPNA